MPHRTAAHLKQAIGSLFLPLFGLSSSAQQLTDKAADAVTSRGELIRRNEELRRENEQLRLQEFHSQEIFRENAQLRKFVGWEQQHPWNLKLARVVSRDPANWWRSVEINKGSRDGLRTNLTVLTMDGLVGRVSSVGLTRSQVILIGDPNCKVSVVIENEARDPGDIIGAAGPFDDSLVTLSYLSKNANVKPGQNVVTSGLGEVFPKGIPVGKIVDSTPVDYGLYLEARVRLAANLSGLEEVWVLFP